MSESNRRKKEVEKNLEYAEHHVEIPATAAESLSASISSTTSDEALEGSSFLEMLHILPLIGDFVRGCSFLLQAILAIIIKDTPQRKTKIGAGIFGALVSLGTGIVGSLFLAGIGLLTTSTALLLAPIFVTSAVIGIYAVTLYRDSYTLYQLELEREHSLNDTVKEKILEKKISRVRWNVVTNLICTIAFTLLLAAIFATGVGAIALAATAGIMIMASTAKRMHDAKQDFKNTILLIGIVLIAGAIVTTGFGAFVLGTIGIIAVAGVLLKKLIDSHHAARKIAAHDMSAIEMSTIEDHHHDTPSNHPRQSSKKDSTQSETKTSYPIHTNHTHIITSTHISIFDHRTTNQVTPADTSTIKNEPEKESKNRDQRH